MKLVVFDLDGTLLDTLRDLTDSVNYAMDVLNLQRYSVEQVRMMVGNGVAKLAERAVKTEHIGLKDEALRLQREYYARHYDVHTAAYDGVSEMLTCLKNRGFTVAVHTNKDESVAQKLCNKYFGLLVDYVCGTTDGIVKPNPSKIVNLMLGLGVNASNTLYCGDSDVDLATAKNLGVNCVSAAWGFRGEDFLRGCGAKYIAQTPQEAAEIILKLSLN